MTLLKYLGYNEQHLQFTSHVVIRLIEHIMLPLKVGKITYPHHSWFFKTLGHGTC